MTVVGDFNKDGWQDVAVSVDLGVSVFLGNGDGTFGPAVFYPVGQDLAIYGLVATDLRGNGTLDLIVATNERGNGVYVLAGNGDGTFGAPVFYPMGAIPSYIAAGDFTNNGYVGVVGLTYGANECACLTVLPGNGDGTFGAPIPTHNVGNTTALTVGNFTGGPNLDVAVANEPGLTIYLGEGNGKFKTGVSYSTGSPPGSIAAASFRNNGIQDLAVGLPFGAGITIYLGNGDGTFTEGYTAPAGFATPAVVGDINGDGYLDLVAITGYPTEYLTTFLGNGDGTFQPPLNYLLNYAPGGLGLGDFNNDKKLDVAISNNSGNAVVDMLNTGVVSFSPTAPLNFKKVKTGTSSAAQTVTLTNTGKSELKISSMKVTGQFGMSTTCGKAVAADRSCKIAVKFSPESQGAKSGTVTIDDSASSKPQVIELAGTGT